MKVWNGLHVVIIGAARQGIALARYLAHQGAEVTLTDHRGAKDLEVARKALSGLPIHWVLGEHPLSLLNGADLVCPSGGVPLTLPLIMEAYRRNIPLSNDSQIFLEAAPCPVIGITGSAGKTTTTSLVGDMVTQALAEPDQSASYSKIWVGGNIGNPLINDLDRMAPDDLAIMELSSFQLELMTRSPHIAAVLNVTPNHLDRHGTMQAYTAAKANILNYQSSDDIAVLGFDDPVSRRLQNRVCGKTVFFARDHLPEGFEGAYTRAGQFYLRSSQVETAIASQSETRLLGEHNLMNILAACAIAHAAGFGAEAMHAGIRQFSGLPHRLEFIRTWGGADWYNDSIATAPERAIAAIRSFERPVVLLAGGRDKDLPWQEFSRVVCERVDHLILFGEAAGKIAAAIGRIRPNSQNGYRRPFTLERHEGLRQGVTAAARIVEAGDIVLLSPGGTSFDEFLDFEERGEAFKKWVLELP